DQTQRRVLGGRLLDRDHRDRALEVADRLIGRAGLDDLDDVLPVRGLPVEKVGLEARSRGAAVLANERTYLACLAADLRPVGDLTRVDPPDLFLGEGADDVQWADREPGAGTRVWDRCEPGLLLRLEVATEKAEVRVAVRDERDARVGAEVLELECDAPVQRLKAFRQRGEGLESRAGADPAVATARNVGLTGRRRETATGDERRGQDGSEVHVVSHGLVSLSVMPISVLGSDRYLLPSARGRRSVWAAESVLGPQRAPRAN